MLAETFGNDATISRSIASRICQRLRAEFDTWKRRDLSTVKIDYCYFDGSYVKFHPKAKAGPVFAAWGITTDGAAVFFGLAPGASESTDAWRGFFAGLKDRGLAEPLLVVSDGGKGLLAAVELEFNNSFVQRCLVHVARNVLAKVPEHANDDVKRDYWAIFDSIEEEGESAVIEAKRRAKRFIAKWKSL